MAEIKLTRIKSIYGSIKGLLGEMPDKTNRFVDKVIVDNFNSDIDDLSSVSETDYSKYKIGSNATAFAHGFNITPNKYMNDIARIQINRIISRVEEEYGFNVAQQSPNIAIFNKNQNEISLQINYTINDLIEKIEDEKGKEKLKKLKEEIEKPIKNWENIKSILIWLINFSKDIFIEILPIILQSFKS